MTSTTSTTGMTGEEFLPLPVVVELTGRSIRTLHRWCRMAQAGKGPFAVVRVKRIGRPWEVHAADLAKYLAASTWPHRTDVAA